MTNQRPLCGGFADVPVDPTKRTLDGDDSGDLYSFLEGALAKEGGVPTPVVILQAARQVVAGLYVRTSPLRPFARPEDPLTRPRALARSSFVRNWKLVVEKDDTSCYEALIYQHLPCNGGGFELKSLETVERARPQERATTEADEADETLEECDQAVSFALQSLSEQSNSLAPFELVKLVRAVKLRNGVHDLALQVRQGRGSTMTVEILVREEDGYRVDKVKFL
jgi:hypothetical protein